MTKSTIDSDVCGDQQVVLCLVTRHELWISNRIYWTLVTRNNN
jgi:hypothetical protein